MLLRSSSTPVLGSLLSSFSDSPNDSHKPHSCSENLNKISFLYGGQHNFHPFSCNSSFPMSHPIAGISDFDRESGDSPLGFRRARSDGNLEGLAADMEDFRNSHPPRSSRRPSSVLQTIPSFSGFNSRNEDEDEEEEEEEEDEDEEKFGEVDGLEKSVTIGDHIMSIGGDFSFSSEKGRSLVVVEENAEGVVDDETEVPALFLARGLGINVGDLSSIFNGGGGGSGSGFTLVDSRGGGDRSDVEHYYKKMVEENPCNPLFLSNYAQFLYQTKGDLEKAEEYYARAILAEPGDGEILSQFAKLIWERHHDQERASNYFEQAVQVSPNDSHILAAYASFLWETEDEEYESGSQDLMGVAIANGVMASPIA